MLRLHIMNNKQTKTNKNNLSNLESVKTVKALLPKITKLYKDLGAQGELYKVWETAKPRKDGMCLNVNDVEDIINGKGVYVVAPPFYNKVTLLNLRSKIFKHPTYLGKALLRSKVKAQFSVIKNSKVVTTADFGRRWLIPLRFLNREAGKQTAQKDELVWWKVGPELVDHLDKLIVTLKEGMVVEKKISQESAKI